MKKLNLLLFCLISLIGIFTSCKKEDDKEYEIRFHIDVTNFREETVYIFFEDGSSNSIQSGKVFTWDRSITSSNKYTIVGIKLANGQIIDQQNISDGGIYQIVVNKKYSDENVSNDIDKWTLTIELSNASSNSVYLFVNGKQSSVVTSLNKLSTMVEITNQSTVLVEVKNAKGDILETKKIAKNGSYITEIKDPVFVITKIVLTKWAANNLIDTPDPWMRISSSNKVIGRTDYFPDKRDGSTCTWSDLNIEIKDVYARIDFDLYDYNFGYSTSGSSFISGVYTTSFNQHWKENSFDMTTSSIQFTLYGVWK